MGAPPAISVALVLKTVVLTALVYVVVAYQRQKTVRTEAKVTKSVARTADAAASNGGAKQPVGGVEAPGADAGKPKLTILFSSQTGTAEGFATTLAQEAAQQGFDARVEGVEDYTDEEIEQLQEEKLLVVVAATYGEGEPADDAIQFVKWLKHDGREPDCMKDCSYSVFGLGDRSYEKFCAMGHLLHNRLAELGGNPLLEAGEGDDSGSIEDDFASWRRKLWPSLRTHAFGAEAGAAVTYKFQSEGQTLNFEFPAPSVPLFTAELSSWSAQKEGSEEPVPEQASLNPLIDGKPWVLGSVQTIRELHTKRSPRSCLHVEIDLAEAAATRGGLVFTQFAAGDHVALMPENNPAEAAALTRRLNCQLSQKVGGRRAP